MAITWRAALVSLLLFGVFIFFWGLGALTYVLAWAILPEEGDGQSILESFVSKYRR